MPQSKSATKRLRQNEARRQRNRTIRAAINTRSRAFQQRVAGGDKEGAAAELKKVNSLLDKATLKGVVKKNYVSRKKSRMAQALNSL